MTDLLAYLVGEGGNYIVFPSLLLFPFILSRGFKSVEYIAKVQGKQNILSSVYNMPDGKYSGLVNALAPYTATMVLLYLIAVSDGFMMVEIILKNYKSIAKFGCIALILSFVYAIYSIHILCKVLTFQNGALFKTRIFLLSYPFITAIFPAIYFFLCATWLGETHSMYDYLWMGSDVTYLDGKIESRIWAKNRFIYSAAICFPWLLYFCFSPKINAIWREIERPRDKKQAQI